MLMVVVLHVLKQGGILDSLEVFSIKYEAAWLLETVVFCAVNCYAIISGYVGVRSRYKYSNLAVLWLRVLYYSIIITILFFVFLPSVIGKKTIFSAVFPVFANQYWYFSAYVLLFVLMPVLNTALKKLSEKRLRWIVIITLTITSVILPITQAVFGDSFKIDRGYSSLWLIILYLVGGYIRQYGLLKQTKTSVLVLLYCGSAVLTWGSKLSIQLLSNMIFGKIKFDQMFICYNSITVLASAVFLVLIFERIKTKKAAKALIGFVAPLVFSVFLIHTHPLVFNMLKDRFVWVSEMPLYAMIPMVLGISLAIFIICCVIDLIREGLFRLLDLKGRLFRLETKIKQRLTKQTK